MSYTSQALTPWFHRHWPAPSNPHQADLLLHDLETLWVDNGKNPSTLHQKEIVAMLRSIGGNSPYLSDLIRKNIQFFDFLLQKGPNAACLKTFETLKYFSIQESRQAIAKQLRIAKQQVALSCALADIGNLWSLQEITETLSDLAEYTLRLATNYLLYHAYNTNKLDLKHPDTPEIASGFIILGMGKLGAKELNYSSDIDLIILYDPDCYPEEDELHTLFIRITRQLVALMEERNEYGYVFRTDLRLRPDPASSPLAVSLPAALSYYESLGQTWERAAMSKARPVAGDIEAGYRFLETIRPFIWRRHLDFAIIDDIHAMKSFIDEHKKTGKQNLISLPPNLSDHKACLWLLGQNIKLGQGGIREIEFCPQTMQLVWGGRSPELRDSTTVGSITKLSEKNLLPASKAKKLIEAYSLLRKTEHRLQMQSDHQTHSLPDTTEALNDFSIFMGYSNPDHFARALFPLMQDVRRIFEELFATPESEEHYILDLPSEELKQFLQNKGFPAEASAILQSWNGSGLRALRTARARTILTHVLPKLLDVLATQRDPLIALQRFDTLLSRHQAGIQLLSLFERNPALIQRIVTVMGTSPFLAEHIANTPAAIDALLETDDLKNNTRVLKQTIRYHLQNTESIEEAMAYLHTLVRGEEFRLSVAFLENRIPLNRSQIIRTALADSIMQALLIKTTIEHQQKHGTIPHGGMCILVLGKAGSCEMTIGSDLDLMLVFDHPPTITESHLSTSIYKKTSSSLLRPRSLSVSQYFLRLVHDFIAHLTFPDQNGSLYEVDMRLRPSGSKGPVAVSLDSFLHYHQNEAWTWERMALTRARVIGGSPALQSRIKTIIQASLDHAPHNQSPQTILHDAKEMLSRLLRDAPPSSSWDIKHRKGGLMEVEFIAQVLQLTTQNHKARHPCTRIAFSRLARQGLLATQEANILIKADLFWRKLQSLSRLFFGNLPPTNLTPLLTPTILEVFSRELLNTSTSDASNFELIEQKIEETSKQVRKLFIKLVGDPEK